MSSVDWAAWTQFGHLDPDTPHRQDKILTFLHKYVSNSWLFLHKTYTVTYELNMGLYIIKYWVSILIYWYYAYQELCKKIKILKSYAKKVKSYAKKLRVMQNKSWLCKKKSTTLFIYYWFLYLLNNFTENSMIYKIYQWNYRNSVKWVKHISLLQ